MANETGLERARQFFKKWESDPLDNMCFPQPGEELSAIEWQLRYGKPTKEQLGVAASVISAYSGLILRKTQRNRNYVCEKLKSEAGRVAQEPKE